MPHEISRTPDGRDAMVYVGQSAWHRLGTRIESSESRDLELVLEKGGLGFEVAKRARHELEVPGPHDPRPAEIVRDGVHYRLNRADPPFSVIRTDTGAKLGEVGDAWQPLQNRHAFEPLRAALDAGFASIETGGVLRGGRDVWLLVQFDRGHVMRTARALFGRLRLGRDSGSAFSRLADTLEGEPGGGILPFGLFYNDHSGSRNAAVQQTAIRVVCANTLEVSLRRPGRLSVEISHRGAVRQDYARAVRNLFRGLARGCLDLADHREILKKTLLHEKDFSRLVLEVAVPVEPLKRMQLRMLERRRERKWDPATSASVERLIELSSARQTEIRRLWEGGAGHRGDRSAWEAWNGLVQWLDHSASASRERDRIESLIHGKLGQTKRQVFAQLLSHANREGTWAQTPSLATARAPERSIPADRDIRARLAALNGMAVEHA